MQRTFTKPALSVTDQIALLERRGMIIADRTAAEHALKHISYYRLRAYWYPFENDPADPDHPLKAGTTLEAVLSLYDFDRRLRLLINDAIERIEVAARGSWAHHLAVTMGPHGYLDPRLYAKQHQYRKNVTQLEEEIARSHDSFIKHYSQTYAHPPIPPVWMVAELMSFGLLSKWISALSSRTDRQAIARPLGLNERIFTSFLHHLATVRNICAHHGRLWNRRLTVTLTLPASPPYLSQAINSGASRQIYNTLVVMLFIMERIAPESDWSTRLKSLMESHPTADFLAMGCPVGWREQPIWRT